LVAESRETESADRGKMAAQQSEHMTIPGLPDSIQVIEWRPATDSDFVFVRGYVQKGPTQFPTFIVVPTEGQEFRYDVNSDAYVPATKGVMIPQAASAAPDLMSFHAACGMLLSGKTKKIARASWQGMWLENHDDGTPLFVEITSDGKEPPSLRTKTWSHNQVDMRARDWKVE